MGDNMHLRSAKLSAADMGRLRQTEPVSNSRRALHNARRHSHPIMLVVATLRTVVIHDGLGGTALDVMKWDQGGILKDHVPHNLHQY